jgi:hypothetical protein
MNNIYYPQQIIFAIIALGISYGATKQ